MQFGPTGVVTRLAHITDAHIAPHGRPNATLKHKSVAILKDLLRQVRERSVDCVLFGGDNIDNRSHGREDLEAFAAMAETAGRFHYVMGNHEAAFPRAGRVSLQDVAVRLAGRGFKEGQYCFSEVVGAVRVIGIDTALMGTEGGYVSEETMAFLADELRSSTEKHIVVLGHHLLYRAWEPYGLQSWDREYLVQNRDAVIALLASCSRVRAYLCGHHHASRIQRIASRGRAGGFYHILSPSSVAFPHGARLLEFDERGIQVTLLRPELDGLIEEGREAVLTGRKARRFATLGTRRDFLDYIEGQPTDNHVFLPYDRAPITSRLVVTLPDGDQSSPSAGRPSGENGSHSTGSQEADSVLPSSGPQRRRA